MYLITYKHKLKDNVGFLNNKLNSIIPSEEVFKYLNVKKPSNMIRVIDVLDENISQIVSEIVNKYEGLSLPLNEVKILAPIPFPRRNIFCIGKNYLNHVKEVSSLPNVTGEAPKTPIYFSKLASPCIGDMSFIDSHPDMVKELDYEAELAVIIGKKCRNVKKEDAEGVIFGYTIANDISARDIQTERMQWYMGKSLDTFCPMGPYIVHKSLLPMPLNLKIKSFVNGELRQSSSTSKMIFDIPTIIEDITKGITLLPGDIILTGTPAGVGAGFNPPKYLKRGDKITCKIDKIGILTNFVK